MYGRTCHSSPLSSQTMGLPKCHCCDIIVLGRPWIETRTTWEERALYKESIVAKWSQWSGRARDPVRTRLVTAQPCRRDDRHHGSQNVRTVSAATRTPRTGTPKSGNHGVVFGASVQDCRNVNRVAKVDTNYIVKIALPCRLVSNIMSAHILTDLTLDFDLSPPLFSCSCSSGVLFGPG
jgi:hypothetical protein